MNDDLAADRDPWEERLRFGQLFLRHLDTLGRPFLPDGQPPITAANYLEMIALGEMLAEADRSRGRGAGLLPGRGLPARCPYGRRDVDPDRRGDRRRRGGGPAPVPGMGRRPAPPGRPERRRVSGPRSSGRKAGG